MQLQEECSQSPQILDRATAEQRADLRVVLFFTMRQVLVSSWLYGAFVYSTIVLHFLSQSREILCSRVVSGLEVFLKPRRIDGLSISLAVCKGFTLEQIWLTFHRIQQR